MTVQRPVRERLREADEAASIAHDYIWPQGNAASQEEANDAIWRIHEIVRPLLIEGSELDTLERRAEAAEDLYKIAVSEHGHDETHSADWPSCLPVHIAMNRYRAALATPAEGAGE